MVATASRAAGASRTSSGSSVDYTSNAFATVEQRRTRKRITTAQLAQLEDLYYRFSHPTRDQRDVLAKRIQMETKSVTIWFQNKRQTDRKVALHNATNSRNVAAHQGSSDTPGITLTAPTSPVRPQHTQASGPHEGPSNPSDKVSRKQPPARSNTLKRAHSAASSSTTSVASTSTASAFRARPSLDRVASRSEIRFTDRAPPCNSGTVFVQTKIKSGNASLALGVTSNAAPPHGLTRRDSSVSARPGSPPPPSDPPLWTKMLSSPLAPSSPPPAEFVAHTRARKIRTLDWACAADRLARGIASPANTPRFGMTSPSPAPAVPCSEQDVGAREREYEEATAMTEDEVELVTPHGSQDISMPWAGCAGDSKTAARTCDMTPAVHAVGLLGRMDETRVMLVMDDRGWQEDEVHAALALCGLRG